MTSPVVGTVSVEINASAKGLAVSIRKAVAEAVKGAEIDKALEDALGKKSIKIKVKPVFDDKDLPGTLPTRRIPTPRTPRDDTTKPVKVPVEVDPLLKAFQAEIKQKIAQLSRQAVRIPVESNTEALQASLKARIEAIQRGIKVEVPTEPSGRAEYEAKLKAQVAETAAKIKANIPVKVDPKDVVVETRRAAKLAQAAAPDVKLKVKTDASQLRALVSGLSAVGTVGRAAATGLGGLTAGVAGISAIAGLASAAAQAIPLISSLGSIVASAAGAMLALPGAAAVAAAGVGTLALAFAGIGGALQATNKAALKASGGGGGGGSVVDTARQIAAATRGVAAARRGLTAANRGLESAERSYQAAERAHAQAQKEVVKAQLAVNQARADAVENIDDLTRSLAGAKLDEEDAALGVTEALRALNEAKLTGNIPDIQRADLAYRKAQQTLEDAKDTTEDLGKEQAEAAKKGVEGSDAVQSALESQQQAVDGLASANDGLADAQDGLAAASDSYASALDSLASAQDSLAQAQQKTASGGGGFNAVAAAMAKLSPAARALVNEINALRPAWEAMQRAVQEALFTGVAAELGTLSASILPTLQKGFVGVADVLNGALLSGMRELETFNTRLRLGQIFDSAKKAVSGLSGAVRPVIRALLDVSAVGSQIVATLAPQFGNFISGIADKLSKLANSGELNKIINDGIATLKQLGAAALDVGGIIKGVFAAAGSANGAGIFGFLDRLNTLVNSTAGQSALTTLFTELGQIGTALTPVLLAVAQALGPVAKGIAGIAIAAGPALTVLVQALGGALASLAPGVIALLPLIGTLASGLQPLADILVGLVTAAAPGLNAVLQALVQGLQAVAPVAPVVGKAIGDILTALAPLLPIVGQALAHALAIVAPLLSALAIELTPLIGLFGQAFTGALEQLLPALLQLGQILIPFATKVASGLLAAFTPLVPVIIQLAATIGQQLMAYLPQFAAVAAQLLPIVVQLGGQLAGVLLQALLSIVPVLPQLVESGLQLVLAFLQLFVAVAPLITVLAPIIAQIVTLAIKSGILRGGMYLLMTIFRQITGVITVATAIIRAIAGVFDSVKNAAARFGAAIQSGASTVGNAARGMASSVGNALGNLYSNMVITGKNVVIGLWNGIADRGGWLWNKIVNFVKDNVKKAFTFGLELGSPSKMTRRMGAFVSEGLAIGMESKTGRVEDAAARIAAAAIPSLGDTSFGMDLSASALSGSLSKATTWEASWAPGMTGDRILDALRGAIKFKHGGSVDRALFTA